MMSGNRFQTSGSLRFSLCIGLLLLIMAGCQDEETPRGNEPELPPYPTVSFNCIEVSEEQKSDAQSVTNTQSYQYTEGRLTGCITTQTLYVVEPLEYKHTTQVSYEAQQAVVSDDFGNVSTYTLDSYGYATSCIRQEVGGDVRNYTFSYYIAQDGSRHLSHIEEELADGSKYAEISLDYTDYPTLHITHRVDEFEQSFTATTSDEARYINLSELPFLFLSEQHPLCLHTCALYGKLLGEPLKLLVTDLKPDGESEGNETVSYSYTFDSENLVTHCIVLTHSYGKKFERELRYVIR